MILAVESSVRQESRFFSVFLWRFLGRRFEAPLSWPNVSVLVAVVKVPLLATATAVAAALPPQGKRWDWMG